MCASQQASNICQQATCTQWTSVYPRAVLQQIAKSRVVASWQIDMSPQVTSLHWTGAHPRAMLQ